MRCVGTANKQELFSDALGSTIAVADDSANALSRHYAYDPDGNSAPTGSGATANLLFAGGHQLNNMYHYGARYYDPATATWTQQDPLNQIASLTEANHYTYVGGDPIDSIDPSGRGLGNIARDFANNAKNAVEDKLADGGAYIDDKVNAVGRGCILGSAAGQGTRAVGSALARTVLKFNGYTAAASCLIGGAQGAARRTLQPTARRTPRRLRRASALR